MIYLPPETVKLILPSHLNHFAKQTDKYLHLKKRKIEREKSNFIFRGMPAPLKVTLTSAERAMKRLFDTDTGKPTIIVHDSASIHQQQQQLKEIILTQLPTDYGIERQMWTRAIISEVIAQRFKVQLKDSRIYELLRELGLSYQPERNALR